MHKNWATFIKCRIFVEIITARLVMKRFFVLFALMIATTVVASAQNMSIGTKVPAIAPAEWYGAQLTVQNEPVLVEFFHTTNRDAKARAAELARLAKKYDGELKVVVVVSQPIEIGEDVVDTTSGYFVAVDTARKIHNAYGVKYVPYSVLVDGKGRLVWLGNSKSLTDKQIEEYVE